MKTKHSSKSSLLKIAAILRGVTHCNMTPLERAVARVLIVDAEVAVIRNGLFKVTTGWAARGDQSKRKPPKTKNRGCKGRRRTCGGR